MSYPPHRVTAGVSLDQVGEIQNIDESKNATGNAETMIPYDFVHDDVVSQDSSDQDVAGVPVRSTSHSVTEVEHENLKNATISKYPFRFASASTNSESLDEPYYNINHPGPYSEDEDTETSGVALYPTTTLSKPVYERDLPHRPNPMFDVETVTAQIKAKYGHQALHQLVKHIVEHELSTSATAKSADSKSESHSKAIAIRPSRRSSGWTRPPPSTPPEAFAYNLSMPTLPDLHPSTTPDVLKEYTEMRAVDPEAFDKKTAEIKEEEIQAKVARGGTAELLRNELTVELATRLDAAMVSKW